VVLASCGGGGSQATTTTAAPVAKKQVVVTTPVLGDFVDVISGGKVRVKVLAAQNTNVRTHVLTPSDVTAVATADLVIQNGLGLEPWFDGFIKTAEHKGPVVNATTGVDKRINETGATDPYAWVSPSNARVMVSNVKAALDALVPDASSTFAANERGYDAQIDSVIAYAQGALDDVQGRRLVYVGEPLGYFCEQFGVKCTGVPAAGATTTSSSTTSTTAPTTSAAPTAAQVTSTVNAIKAATPVAVVFGADVPASVVDATQKALPNAKITSGEDALRVDSVGNQSKRHPNYLALERDITDLVSAQLR
jgi:ABC-type Zn uptake system ZnuABC Zn-binding protein ZnuA